ncbi:MAG TPA: trypsin-like peptidase domain-containing protein [Thermoguttaceae bacterium]|nr:trypsin-like peptidase domain-containing protein [Thermoguttaceae bacterium]
MPAQTDVDEQTGRPALRRTPAVEVFEKWKDSVVYVTGPVVPGGGSKLAEFFNLPDAKLEQSVGTGFVVHGSGYVVTNAHAAGRVIAHEVVLSDGKKCPAELVASIRSEDLALLKIDAARPLPAVKLARSGDLLIGEPVIVIANPHGLMSTCTQGIVSAIGRQTNLLDVEGVTLTDMIQTDAGINPGSSGGPWFNVLGEVIGLTASMKRDSQNIGFAISAASLRRLLPEMLDVERRYGFVTGVSVAADGPCRVEAVAPDSPAARAGIRVDDLVVKLADAPIATVADYHLALIGRKAEETLTVELLRGEESAGASLLLAKRPKPDVAALLREKLGLEAAPLDDAKAESMSLRVPRGVVITSLDAGHYQGVEHPPAAGDVLASIDAIRPRDLDHLGLLLDRLKPGQRVPLVILRRQDDASTRIDVSFVVPKK